MSKIIDYSMKIKKKTAPIQSWQDVERISLRSGLTTGTIQMLVDRGFGSVRTLRDITEDDLEALPLYVGQQLTVAKLVNHINAVLVGFEDEDDPINDKTPTENASAEDSKDEGKEEEEGEKEGEGKSSTIGKAGLMEDYNSDREDEGQEDEAFYKLPLPHQFIVGCKSRKHQTQEEFLYGNLLILEYFIQQRPSEVKASLRHIRFLILKLLNGYPLLSVIEYDAALRKKIQKSKLHMPREADQDLIQKHLMMMAEQVERHGKQKKKKVKGRGKSSRESKEEG